KISQTTKSQCIDQISRPHSNPSLQSIPIYYNSIEKDLIWSLSLSLSIAACKLGFIVVRSAIDGSLRSGAT
ncbi:hypothetical protein GIB67_042728, partial [Kingdonia uniflora]